MLKKILTFATLMCVIPMMANAATKWQLGTRAMSQGGVINSRNMTGQTVVNGGLFKQYTSANNSTVTVIPNAGFKISKISNNGIISGPFAQAQNYTNTPAGTGPVTIQATFARLSFVLSASVGTGGTVNTTSFPVVYSGLQSPAKSFIFTPNPGFAVTSITETSTPAVNGTHYQFLNAVTNMPITLPAAVGVKVKVNVVNVPSDNIAFTAFFGGTATAPVVPPTAANAAQLARTQCANCHATQGIGQAQLLPQPAVNVFNSWSASIHKSNPFHIAMCYDCHAGANLGAHPGTVQCASCHSGTFGFPDGTPVAPSDAPYCNGCHSTTTPADIHSANVPTVTSCIACHDVAIRHPGTVVNDNNGVRAITTEFAKWSHHVTGVALQDAHCAACHLEGKVLAGAIVPDSTYHMADAKTHLRNADSDADMQWDPAAPNHTTMDNFCMSCHDSDGATSAASDAIQGLIVPAPGKTASASNPFGDTISNRYDKMQRPAVVDASSQFNTTNNSHHAVKGPRYTGRTRTAGPRQIASPATFAANSSAVLQGVRKTLFDAGNLNQLYTPLENAGGETVPRTGAASLGDDSTLHCGDCHTVGQWKVASSETANGSPTPVAIGAHGSNNEYMLRNSIGTDERHTQNAFLQGNITGSVLDPNTGLPIPNGVIVYTNPNGAFLVCYNCHNYNKYGSIFLATGVLGGHVGEYDAQGRCNGIGNTIPFNGFTTGKLVDGSQFASRFEGPITKYSTAAPYAGEQNPDFGNIFGIQCNNCHNSGAGNGYGGIHGSPNNTNATTADVSAVAAAAGVTVNGGAYIDGMGNVSKVMRFLPGLGNAAHVPGTLGGFTGGSTVAIDTAAGTPNYTYITGGVSNDTNWEQKHWQQAAAGTTIINSVTGAVSGGVTAGAGCYTLGGGAPALPSTVHQGANAAANRAIAPSVTGAGGAATSLFDTWGGCDDHDAGQGRGDHGFVKKIVRPVTY